MPEIKINLKGVDEFYSTSVEGIGLSTHTELMEIATAFVTGTKCYDAIFADKKVNEADLQYVGLLIKFIQDAKVAVTFEGPVDIGKLTPSQVQDILAQFLKGIFTIFKIEPSGSTTANFEELKEIFDALSAGVALFGEFVEDGKITIGDLLSNVGGILNLGKAVMAAAKIDGKIELANLTPEQISSLLSQVVSDVYKLLESLKKLQG